jgi:hypothetical protein
MYLSFRHDPDKMGFCYLDEKFPFLAIMFRILNLQKSKVTSRKQLKTLEPPISPPMYTAAGEGGITHLCWGTNGVALKTLNQKIHQHNIYKFGFFLTKNIQRLRYKDQPLNALLKVAASCLEQRFPMAAP